MTETSKPTIAIIGGTGAEGSGLAVRWAAAGYAVIIGSRDGERAATAAAELSALTPDDAPDMRVIFRMPISFDLY